MKRIVLSIMACLCVSSAAFAAGPASYQCIRPDGTVVCTINAYEGDPSVICNHDCPDCNLTCVAQQRVVRDGDELLFNPGATPAVRPKASGSGAAETPQHCQEQRQECIRRCNSNPNDAKQFDRNACISACESTFSGCGTQP